MSVRSLVRLSALVLAGAFSATVPASFGVTREFTQTYTLNATGTVELNNVNGTVRIEGWDKNQVEVRATKTTPDRESNLDLVAIDIDAKPDALSITTRYPQEEGVEVAVDYTIHVPKHAQLTHVTNVNGTLRVIDLFAVGDLHTVNGNIEIYEGGGDVHAHTTNGNVYLELKHPNLSTGAFAETTNGSVLLAIPSDLQADLEARCMNGNFTTELPFMMQGAAQQRVLHGKLGHGGMPIKVGTVNGTVQVVALKSTV
jgi:DUF4097 and DUF4098 domain-containing protein YvlB